MNSPAPALSAQPSVRREVLFTIYAALAAFGTYTCMYAFRKGITAATFEGMSYGGISYKIWLVNLQVLGYALSKMIGVKVVSEAKPQQRGWYIVGLMSVAGAALGLFWLVPAPWNMVFFLLNGLPLGMIYGLVFGYLEGRKQTDVLVAALTASFIFGSGFVKSVALFVMQQWGVSEFGMPIVTALLFAGPAAVFLTMLMRLPPPTAEDRALKAPRPPMNADDRRQFVRTFLTGLVCFIAGYILLTVIRDFRDNFGREIFRENGINDPAVFTQVETPIAVGILIVLSLLGRIQDNFRAFVLVNTLTLSGVALALVGTWLFQTGQLGVSGWMVTVGAGMYLGYVPANGVYFERLMASFRYAGTVGFVIMLADTYGYMGSFALQVYKSFASATISYTSFLASAVYIGLGLYGLLMTGAFVYFVRKHRETVASGVSLNG